MGVGASTLETYLLVLIILGGFIFLTGLVLGYMAQDSLTIQRSKAWKGTKTTKQKTESQLQFRAIKGVATSR